MPESPEPIDAVDGMLTTPTTGLEMHYRDWGGDGRPILLLHGLASSARIWDFVAPLLRPYGRVIALDQRGHGATDKPDSGYDVPTFVADVAGALQALGLAGPVIVGHSWGAGVALAYAAADSACAGAALVDGGVVDLQLRPDATWEETARRLAPPDLSRLRLDDLVAYMGQGPLAALPESFRRAFFRSLMAEQPDGTVRPRLTRPRHLAILRSMWDTRPAALLAAVHCPVLVVLADPPGAAAADPFQAAKAAGLVPFAAHPGVTIHHMADTIHDAPLQRPAALASLITAWLEQGTEMAHG